MQLVSQKFSKKLVLEVPKVINKIYGGKTGICCIALRNISYDLLCNRLYNLWKGQLLVITTFEFHTF